MFSRCKQHAEKSSISFDFEFGRARHFVRAAVCKSTRSAGRATVLVGKLEIWIFEEAVHEDCPPYQNSKCVAKVVPTC
jgi:hypothetical protein